MARVVQGRQLQQLEQLHEVAESCDAWKALQWYPPPPADVAANGPLTPPSLQHNDRSYCCCNHAIQPHSRSFHRSSRQPPRQVSLYAQTSYDSNDTCDSQTNSRCVQRLSDPFLVNLCTYLQPLRSECSVLFVLVSVLFGTCLTCHQVTLLQTSTPAKKRNLKPPALPARQLITHQYATPPPRPPTRSGSMGSRPSTSTTVLPTTPTPAPPTTRHASSLTPRHTTRRHIVTKPASRPAPAAIQCTRELSSR